MDSIIKRGGVIGKNSFREYVNSYLYIKSDILLSRYRKALSVQPEDEGIVGMCYIDMEEGVSFDVFCSAYMERGKLICNKKYPDPELILYISELNETEYISLTGLPYRKEFLKKRDEIVEKVSTPEQKALEEVRKIRELDINRNLIHPDNVYAYLYKQDYEMDLERIQVKCLGMENGAVICKLLSEPTLPFGVHEGDQVKMNFVRMSDGAPPFWACLV